MLSRLKVKTQLLVLIGTSLILFLAAIAIGLVAPEPVRPRRFDAPA